MDDLIRALSIFKWSSEKPDRASLWLAPVVFVAGGVGVVASLMGRTPQFREHSWLEIGVAAASVLFWGALLWVGGRRFVLLLEAMLLFQVESLLVSAATRLPGEYRAFVEQMVMGLPVLMLLLVGAFVFERVRWRGGGTRARTGDGV